MMCVRWDISRSIKVSVPLRPGQLNQFNRDLKQHPHTVKTVSKKTTCMEGPSIYCDTEESPDIYPHVTDSPLIYYLI